MTADQSPVEPLFLIAQQTQRKALQARKRKLARQAQAKNDPDHIVRAPQRSARQQTGDHYEQAAWRLVQQAGCQLLGRQLTCPLGELDLVVREGTHLVFIEVRQRASKRFGGAAASVSTAKQQRFLRAAQWWLPKLVHRHFDRQLPTYRLDVIAFESDGAVWYRDAIRLPQDK
jgi:putative endonuclease